MKTRTKRIIITGVMFGFVFAGITAGFDYVDGIGFRMPRFVFNALFFGMFMGLVTRGNCIKK